MFKRVLTPLGSDYDGDKIRVLWDADIVDAFTNADLDHLLNPETVAYAANAFTENTHTINRVISKAKSEADRSNKLKSIFLDLYFTDRSFGLISRCHTAFTYKYGPTAGMTIRAAHLFGIALDAPKQGKSIVKKELDALLSRADRSPWNPLMTWCRTLQSYWRRTQVDGRGVRCREEARRLD
jgi:hypothetical protein